MLVAMQELKSCPFIALDSRLAVVVSKEISGIQTERSTPLSISGTLLAVGGKDGQGLRSVSSIFAYQVIGVRADQLQTTRWNCACSMIVEGKIFVDGGHGREKLKSMDSSRSLN